MERAPSRAAQTELSHLTLWAQLSFVMATSSFPERGGKVPRGTSCVLQPRQPPCLSPCSLLGCALTPKLGPSQKLPQSQVCSPPRDRGM